MSDPIELTDEFIYSVAPDGKSVKAALDLINRNAYRSARASEDWTRLQAQCQGSDPRPYAVEVDLSNPKKPGTGCNCASPKHPCKHAIGLMFLAARSPEAFAGGAPRKAKVNVSEAGVRHESSATVKPPTDLREALMQAIVADPEDEGPRLIFADWLEENGDEADRDRAEFIRVQMELARDATPARAKQLAKREKELWAAHKDAWLAHLPPHLRNKRGLRFHRGFLEELSIPPSSWAKHGAKLFGQNPIYRVHLPKPVNRNVVGDLVVIPDLARVRELTMKDSEIQTPLVTLGMLVNSPFLTGLTRLTISGCHLSTHGLRVLIDSPLLARLVELDLSNNAIGQSGAEALAAAPDTSRLRKLTLTDNPIGDVGAEALAKRFGERVMMG